jgi:endonuclease III
MSGEEVVRSLDKLYPNIKTPLAYSNVFQLLIATVLSAQSTDAQVNRVTPALFRRFPDPETMSKASQRGLEEIIRSTGFFHVKAKRLKEISRKIMQDFGGEVPTSMEELKKLPGVGRKTANIVLSAGFNKIEGIAVDTHVLRLSRRIGLTSAKTPEKIEEDLMRITPKSRWPRLTMLLIFHGRNVCFARRPQCGKCVLSSGCAYYNTVVAPSESRKIPLS